MPGNGLAILHASCSEGGYQPIAGIPNKKAGLSEGTGVQIYSRIIYGRGGSPTMTLKYLDYPWRFITVIPCLL